jgi:hypothetical protein
MNLADSDKKTKGIVSGSVSESFILRVSFGYRELFYWHRDNVLMLFVVFMKVDVVAMVFLCLEIILTSREKGFSFDRR